MNKSSIRWLASDVWLPVPTHPRYSVNPHGLIVGHRGLMRPMTMESGHRYILAARARPRKLFIHRAVLLAFVGPCPAGMECLHGDGNPANNRLDNLRGGRGWRMRRTSPGTARSRTASVL